MARPRQKNLPSNPDLKCLCVLPKNLLPDLNPKELSAHREWRKKWQRNLTRGLRSVRDATRMAGVGMRKGNNEEQKVISNDGLKGGNSGCSTSMKCPTSNLDKHQHLGPR